MWTILSLCLVYALIAELFFILQSCGCETRKAVAFAILTSVIWPVTLITLIVLINTNKKTNEAWTEVKTAWREG